MTRAHRIASILDNHGIAYIITTNFKVVARDVSCRAGKRTVTTVNLTDLTDSQIFEWLGY